MPPSLSFRSIVVLSLAILLVSACSPATPEPSPVALAPAAATVPPTVTLQPAAASTPTAVPTDTSIPPTETPVPSATPVPPTATPTKAPTETPTDTATPTLTPSPSPTATRVPTRKPTVAPTVALKCPPLPPFQGQTLPGDIPLPLPLSKSGYGEFGGFVFQNLTNQKLSIEVSAGIVHNFIDLPPGTEYGTIAIPGPQLVKVDYPQPGGTECTYQVTADQVLFMQIGAK